MDCNSFDIEHPTEKEIQKGNINVSFQFIRLKMAR